MVSEGSAHGWVGPITGAAGRHLFQGSLVAERKRDRDKIPKDLFSPSASYLGHQLSRMGSFSAQASLILRSQSIPVPLAPFLTLLKGAVFEVEGS